MGLTTSRPTTTADGYYPISRGSKVYGLDDYYNNTSPMDKILKLKNDRSDCYFISAMNFICINGIYLYMIKNFYNSLGIANDNIEYSKLSGEIEKKQKKI